MKEYKDLLEDETFRGGAERGRVQTSITILTDMLIELNALEIYYQKPIAKSVQPAEIKALREKILLVKDLLRANLQSAE